MSLPIKLTLLGLLLPLLHTAQIPLFSDYKKPLHAKHLQIKNNNLQLPTVKRNRVIFIENKPAKDDLIQLQLFDNQQVIFQLQDIGYAGVNMPYRTGQTLDKTGSAAFIIHGKRMTGHLSGRFGNYEIYPLGGQGVHLLAELDNTAFKACGNESKYHRELIPEPVPIDKNVPSASEKSMAGTECFLRLLVPYTTQARIQSISNGANIMTRIALAIVESNQGYANSNVELRVELAYAYETDDAEGNDQDVDKVDLQSSSDGRWDEVHNFRNFYDADMVGLVTGTSYPDVAGSAFGFDYTNDANMFMVAEYPSITGNLTFAHEFGHQQGCRHHDDNTQTPFTYARGRSIDGVFRTVMGKEIDGGSNTTRINYWSNPDITAPGFSNPTGSSTRDNARALDFGDFTVAHHRTTPTTYSTSQVINNNELLNMVAVTTLNSFNTVEVGGQLELKTQREIILQPGFHAKAGSSMRAHIIDACNASYSLASETVDERTTVHQTTFNTTPLSIAPNPTNKVTTLNWQLATEETVQIYVVNLYGQVVAVLQQHQLMAAGKHQLTWQIEDVAAGMHQVVLEKAQGQEVVSLVIF